MKYEVCSLEGSGKDIIQRVIGAKPSQLLVPPKLKAVKFEVPTPPSDNKYIGLFSSGTTNSPVCIWNKYENLVENAVRSAKAFEVLSSDRLLMMALPWHVAGFSWMLMAEHLSCEYTFLTTQKGEDAVWRKSVQKVNPDYLFTVPAVLNALYGVEWFAQKIAFGGYPLKFENYKKLAPHCEFMYQGYGQTEAGGLISSYKRRSSAIPFDSENLCQGKPIEGVRLECSGTQSNPAPIYITSETAFTENKYNSGDVGYFDESENIYVAGRSIFTAEKSGAEPKDLLDSL